MKKLFYVVVFLSAFAFAKPANAQVNVSINIGSQPLWGPGGYDYARYYYMPEMDVYYNVSSRHYTYYDGGRWVSHRSLPSRYGRYDLHRTYKVALNDSNPWRNHRRHRSNYHGYSRNYSQVSIRDYGRGHKHHGKSYKKAHKEYRKAEKRHAKYHKQRESRRDRDYRNVRGMW